MRIYDTAMRRVVELEPRESRITMYVCGITPYDSAHLGHAFTYHVYDVLTRRLRGQGVGVRSVRNVTDVDDDMLRVSRERNADYRVLAADQVSLFDREMRAIGVLDVDSVPRASQHVPEMVDWIERLVDAGFAYAADGWVYFDTTRDPSYGRLGGLDRSTMIALSRERGADPDDSRKRDRLDFVLWQRSLPDEPHWPSPWSQGRPGWHIECTVLSTRELGTPIDIHGGGDDLIYPHHESEIAQAETLGVSPYVRHWMHVAMVKLGGEKMSKSLGNLVFVHDLLEHAPAPAARLLLAAHHHRQPWDYEPAELDLAIARLSRYTGAMHSAAGLDDSEAAEWEQRFWERIDDDLDTPGALTVLDELTSALGRRPVHSGGVRGDDRMARLLDTLGVALPSRIAP